MKSIHLVALNFNLRRYNLGAAPGGAHAGGSGDIPLCVDADEPPRHCPLVALLHPGQVLTSAAHNPSLKTIHFRTQPVFKRDFGLTLGNYGRFVHLHIVYNNCFLSTGRELHCIFQLDVSTICG